MLDMSIKCHAHNPNLQLASTYQVESLKTQLVKRL
jgi:hypothetical protein